MLIRRRLAVALLAAALAAGVAGGASHAGSTATPERVRDARQACADRWSWMHMHWGVGTQVFIQSTSPCRLAVRYSTSGYDVFWCDVNGFGGWECASHAQVKVPASTRWNATTGAGGKLVLAEPPRTHAQLAPPAWVRRYPVDDGYILPFDAQGHLRPGVSLTGTPGVIDCFGEQPAPGTKRLDCVASSVCFAPLPRATPSTILACIGRSGNPVYQRARWS